MLICGEGIEYNGNSFQHVNAFRPRRIVNAISCSRAIAVQNDYVHDWRTFEAPNDQFGAWMCAELKAMSPDWEPVCVHNLRKKTHSNDAIRRILQIGPSRDRGPSAAYCMLYRLVANPELTRKFTYEVHLWNYVITSVLEVSSARRWCTVHGTATLRSLADRWPNRALRRKFLQVADRRDANHSNALLYIYYVVRSCIYLSQMPIQYTFGRKTHGQNRFWGHEGHLLVCRSDESSFLESDSFSNRVQLLRHLPSSRNSVPVGLGGTLCQALFDGLWRAEVVPLATDMAGDR